MADYLELQIPSATVTATGASPTQGTGAVNYPSPPKISQGFTSGIFVQEITAVNALVSWDEDIQFLLGNQASWAYLYDTAGNKLSFPQTAVVGLSVLAYQGVIPANLRTYGTLAGTSVTRQIDIALGG